MTHRQRRKLLAGCLLGASLFWPVGTSWAGDGMHRWCVDNCATIPKGAQPAPLGTYVNRWIDLQQTKAESDDFVLYKHMWYRGGTTLGPLGLYQLDLITRRLPGVPFPVVIETSKNEKLDEQRREVVAALLAMRGMNDPTRVIVAYPIAEGLFGDEAPRVYNGLLGLNNFFGGGLFGSFGTGFGAGFGGFGGFGGGFGGFGGFGGGFNPFGF
jgi:hypothetical protein